MISLQGVSKKFKVGSGYHTVFDNLNLDFPTSSSTALLGRNGAGKSTLMSIIAGSLQPDAGRVVRDCTVSWPVGLSSGFQGSLTGRQNVAFVCRINGDSRKQIERRTEFVESFADVGRYFDMPMNTYSSGMRSRVSFGMSMAFDFDMYLVDEVTSVGDGDFQKKCNAVFDQKRAGMSGMILVSHSMSLVEKWCDRAVYIDRGEVKVYENLSEAIERYKSA